MADAPTERNIEILRSHLKTLPEAGNASDGATTLEDRAEEWSLDSADLRKFREGDNGAIPIATVNLLSKMFSPAGMLSGTDVDSDALRIADPSTGGWYKQAFLQEITDRRQRFEQYRLIDQTRPEARSALDCWADLAVVGSVGEDVRHMGGFEPEPHPSVGQDRRTALSQISNNVTGNLLNPEQQFLVVRNIVKFGDAFGELGLGQSGGRYDIVALRPRLVDTMFLNPGPNGQPPTDAYYKQCMPGKPQDPVATFPRWKIAHWANRKEWGSRYGESLFASLLRSYIQIEAVEASMIIRRLERASQKYKRVLDTRHCHDEATTKKAIDDYKRTHRKVRTVDGNKNYAVQRITPPPGEDEIVARPDKDSPADVSVLEGDASIDKIEDYQALAAKWFSGLGPPKAHLGYEEGTMRSVVTDLHIVFARKCRRLQLQFCSGLLHLIHVSLILRGIDPRTLRFTIFPPSLGTRDELIRAQVQLLHATTVKYLADAFGQTGKMPSIQWLLKYVMGMDDEVIDALELADVLQQKPADLKGGPDKGPPSKESAEMAIAALTNPKIDEQREHLQWMIEERQLKYRTGAAWAKYERLMVNPFGPTEFDRVVRSLGITELRTS